MAKIQLKTCPFCGKEIEIHTHPEWGNRGVEYGALIHHKDCVNGMEVLLSIHHQGTEEDACNMLANSWNKRIGK